MKIQTLTLLLLFNLMAIFSMAQGNYLGIDKANGKNRIRIYKGDFFKVTLLNGDTYKGELQEVSKEFFYLSDMRIRFDEISSIKYPRKLAWLQGIGLYAGIGSGIALAFGYSINGASYNPGPWGPVFITSVGILTLTWIFKNKRYKIKSTEQIKILNTTPIATQTTTSQS